jgi:hypothetical protein
MGCTFSGRSLTIAVVLLVSGFEAITPDADDLASSLAFRILVQAADPGRSSDDENADKPRDLAACGILAQTGTDRSVETLRRAVNCPIGSAPVAYLHGSWFAASVRPAPSILKSSSSGYRLDC